MSPGGTAVHGGRTWPDELRIEPTVVTDPAPDEPLMIGEIFGPVLPVLGVGSVDEAIDIVNSRGKPLAAYLFSRSRAAWRRIVAEVPAGGVVVGRPRGDALPGTRPALRGHRTERGWGPTTARPASTNSATDTRRAVSIIRRLF